MFFRSPSQRCDTRGSDVLEIVKIPWAVFTIVTFLSTFFKSPSILVWEFLFDLSRHISVVIPSLLSLSALTRPSSSSLQVSSCFIAISLVSLSPLSSTVFPFADVSSLFSESFSVSSLSLAFSRLRHFARRFWNQTWTKSKRIFSKCFSEKFSISFNSNLWVNAITFITFNSRFKNFSETDLLKKKNFQNDKVSLLQMSLCSVFETVI